jgi:hypothetical protein
MLTGSFFFFEIVYREEFRRCRRKEYIIRAITVLVTVTFSTCTVVGGIAYLENVENFRPKE